MSKRIAVVGAGISGLVSAHLLSKQHEVVVFEANDYLGGHTHTVDLAIRDKTYAIDTGFIVFNQQTYPYFCQLLKQLNVPFQPSEMSFSFRSDELDFEYNGHNLNTLFADRKHLFKPAFYRFIRDILRFNQLAFNFLKRPDSTLTINAFLVANQFSSHFIRAYFIPMVSAIWSAKPTDIYAYSALFILQFFANHGLLNSVNRPPWFVVKGGSRSYIEPLIQSFKDRIHLNTPIESIRRVENGVFIKVKGHESRFDAVVIAAHSDQALKMLLDPSQNERAILSAIPYQQNEVVLHHDTRLLPKRKRAWASWNYRETEGPLSALTYYMNRLQGLDAPLDLCVSVNQTALIDKAKIFHTFHYAHPCFTQAALEAQKQHALINGQQNTYYCGAYWGYGFHEDGVKSAITACEPFGVAL